MIKTRSPETSSQRHQRVISRHKALLLAICSIALWAALQAQSLAITLLSEGYLTPETISQAPANFGSYGGYFFIPDFARGSATDTSLRKIWAMPPNGGSPTVFATNPNTLMVGGLFLPDNGWGVNSGRYLTTGRTTPASGLFTNDIYVYDSTGGAQLFKSLSNSYVAQPRIAPSGFGSFGGQVLLPDARGVPGDPARLLALAPNGTVSEVATNLTASFGLAFAPAGFGAFGGQALVSSSSSGAIISVKADGTFGPFANVTLSSGQIGLRQMEFTPAGFIPGYSELLLVSVSGSSAGGGTLGDVFALDSEGHVVFALRSNLGLTKFDPRGLVFRSGGELLISDSSDPIYLATAQDFRPCRNHLLRRCCCSESEPSLSGRGPNGPNQAMQRTASKPAIGAWGVCRPRFGCESRFTGLAVADLGSR